MSRKIIGITVGTTLPKPNFKQNDPTKGDYIKNKPDFDGLKTDLNDLKTMVGDTSVAEQVADIVDNTLVVPGKAADAKVVGDALAQKQPVGDYALKNEIPSVAGLATETYVNNAISNIDFPEEIYVQNEEPTEVKEGTLWLDLDEDLPDNNKIEIENFIIDELAKRGQLKPEFANTIEECTDTSKLYVLPDGYIYGYMYTEDEPQFINQLTNAIDKDGKLYNNGLGYNQDTYINSSGVESTSSGWITSGFIPYSQQNIIRMCGPTVMPDVNAGKLQFYNASFTLIGSTNISAEYAAGTITVEESPWSGVYVQTFHLDLSETLNSGTYQSAISAKYIRFMLPSPDINKIYCTFDEEIAFGASSGWKNTGHIFVSSGFEDRIANLEDAQTDNDIRITALESIEVSGIPNYVKTEAESVIDRIIAAQGNRTFTLAAITDIHHGAWNYTGGVTHACQALKYIDERIKLDAVAVLGDYTEGYPHSDYDNAIADFKAVNKVLDGLRFTSNMRLAGNHDIYAENPALTMRYINAYSDDVVWGSRPGGYFYRDFDGYKIRVICVNTSETTGGLDVTSKQYNWFVKALDLSSKEDVEEWGILILSHHPLDWYPTDETYRFCYILDAYKNGTSGTTGEISYDFTNGKNAAMIIGNIHGHIHNFKVDYIHFGNVNGNAKSGVMRIATPNVCYNRENEYGAPWAEDKAYNKTQNTAQDTSFCIYCIDLDTHTINAICYGAGYDREIVYYEEKKPIVNLIDTIGYTNGGRISTSSGSQGTKDGYVCTGFITLEAEGDVYRTAGVNFNADVEYDRGICVYTNDGTYKAYESAYLNKSPITMGHNMGTLEVDSDGNLTYTVGSCWNFEGSPRKIRFCGYGTGANLIITKNQSIE